MTGYDSLAAVYDWLVPEPLLTPEGSADAFAPLLARGTRVLDCAAGTGTLAAGLARRGFDVVASDASPAMLEQAARRGLSTRVCRWDELGAQGWAPFDAVLCVGNSLAHTADRRAALAGMRAVLVDGGQLVLTSRNWAKVCAAGSRVEVGERLVERHGRRALVIYAWTIAAEHAFEVVVALVDDDGAVTPHRERFAFFPFTYEELCADLRAAGFTPGAGSDPDADRYLVTARAA
jgi:2-polyprenyl-3-methyl-5-hydroxy-6-metoxy-1,4-benzoquinol methylase